MTPNDLSTKADLSRVESKVDRLLDYFESLEPPRMNIHQAAKYCKKSPRTVTAWIKSGRLKAEGPERFMTVAVRDLEPFRRK